jgi:hypothetical protein
MESLHNRENTDQAPSAKSLEFGTIIRNAKFRILPPQPASLVSTGQTAKTPQNHEVPRHFADTARSPCPNWATELSFWPLVSEAAFGVAFLLDPWPSPCSVVRPVSSTLHAIRRSCDTRSTASSIVRRNEIDNVCRGPTLIRWEAHGEVGMCPGRRRGFPRFSRMRLMMRITSARCTRPLRDCQSRSGGSRYPKAASRVGAGRRRCP